MRGRLPLWVLLGVLGCTAREVNFVEDAGGPPPDAGCLTPCGVECCPTGQECRDGRCQPPCVPECADKQCGPDGCGRDCGSCPDQTHCTDQGRCEPDCTDNDLDFCQREQKQCGTYSGTDRCDQPRTANCGACAIGEECEAPTNTCKIICDDDAAFCSKLGIRCGSAAGTDNCGATRTVAECGPCGPDDECVAGQCILCVAETEDALCAAANRACGALTVTDRCRDERRIGSCGSCKLLRVCSDQGQCEVPAGVVLNDTCAVAGADPLVFDANGVANAQVDLTDATNDGDGSCGSQSGADVVFPFTLGAAKNVLIVATPESGSLAEPVLYVRSSCGQAADELAAACSHAVGQGPSATLTLANLAAGDYWLWLDSDNPDTVGSVALTVTLTDPLPPPAEDLCAGALPLTLDSNGEASATGHTTDALDDYSGSCATQSGPDVVYYLTLQSDAALTATLTNATFPAAVYIRSDCASPALADEKACGASEGTSAPRAPVATARLVPAGIYYIVVDGLAGYVGSFTLKVAADAPILNDDCTDPETLHFDALGMAATYGNTALALDNGEGSCANGTGRDVVYALELASEKHLEITVSPTAGPGGGVTLMPNVYLRSQCAQTSSEVACLEKIATSPTTLRVSRLPAGVYYLWVDGAQRSSGPFTLQVTAIDPLPAPANDLCAAAEPLALDDGTQHLSADTWGATDDSAGGCASSSHRLTGPDLVYALTLRGAASLRVTASRDAGAPTFEPALYLRDGCGATATEAGCARAISGTATLRVPTLPAGTWYLVVDGEAGTAGAFALDVVVGEPTLHDACSGTPRPLAFGSNGIASASGDSEFGANDTNGSCQTGNGKDLVYALTLADDATVHVVLAPVGPAGLLPTVYLRSACDDPTTELGCATFQASGTPVVLDFPRLRADTYYLWVDSPSAAAAGEFALEVSTFAVTVPRNDVCPGALLPLTEGVGTLAGDTTFAWNDSDGNPSSGLITCAGLNGPDLVYAFDLPVLSSVTVQVNGTSPSFSPSVYVRSECESTAQADQRACAQGTAGVAIATAPQLPPGRYYVFVDAPAGQYGTFELTVTQTPLTIATDCSNPIELTLDASGHASTTGNTTLATYNYNASCNGSPGRDIAYQFTTSDVQNLLVTVTPTGGSTLRPSVWVRGTCDVPVNEVGCAYATSNGAALSLPITRLPAGTWYLIVDSAVDLNGPFTLELTATTPAAAPANDLCADAQALNVTPLGGPVTVTGDTRNAGNESGGTCATLALAHNGGDVVYTFTLSEDAGLTAKVTRRTVSTFNPAVYIRSSCASAAASNEFACANHSSGTATASATYLPAGTYYVIVDGLNATAGDFTLVLTPSGAIPNDSCLAPQAMTLDTAGTATASGTTAGASKSGDGSCSPSSGPDVVYSFQTNDEKDLTISVNPTTSYKLALYVRSQCALNRTELACSKAASNGQAVTVNLARAPAGVYYVWVDAQSSTTGPFNLTVTATDPVSYPANDTCRVPQTLAFDATTHKATTSGDTTAAGDDYRGTCTTEKNPLSGGDVAYQFTLPSDASVIAKVTRDAASPAYQPALYIRDLCGSDAWDRERACALEPSAASATAMAPALPAGTYYLIVDGIAGSRGLFALDVTWGPPLRNDTCATAEPLTFDSTSGVAQASGDLSVATAHGAGSCASAGPDAVYSFTLAQPRAVELSLAGSAGSALRPAVHLRSACDLAAAELGCNAAAAAPGPATLSFPALAAGRYFLWVDSASTTEVGPFTLTVTTSAPQQPVPPENACAGAIPLAFDTATNHAPASGSTAWAVDTTTGTCEVGNGADVVYWFVTTQTWSVTTTVTATGTPWMPSVYLRASCASDAALDEVTCGRQSSGVATATAGSLAAGTWYVVVDGLSGTRGGFNLDVALAAPTNAPANDTCFHAEPLVISGLNATATGTTVGAQNEATGSCAQAAAADVVYALTMALPHKITATVTPSAQSTTFRPAVYVRSSCGSLAKGDELACRAASGPGQQAKAVVNRAPAGQYFIWVDGGGSSATSGGFTLDVALDPVAPAPPNDDCANATALAPGVTVFGSTAAADADYGPVSSAACGTKACAAPEVVYVYTPSVTGNFTVTVQPSGFDAVVWAMGGSCGDPFRCTAIVDAAMTGGLEALVVPGYAGKPYYLVVDGNTATAAGPFTIRVDP